MKKRYIFLSVLLVIILGFFVASRPKSYEYKEKPLPASFETYYNQKLAASKAKGARPGNEEKWINYSDEPTKVALLYIHGFSASRGEGEYVVDSLAKVLQANTYYLRLPGHGTNIEDHASVSFNDYLDDANEALRMMQTQGEKVIIVGTSMGGMVATYLAATNPDLVDGLVLCSPFYDFGTTSAGVLKIPGAISVIKTIDGPDRKMGRDSAWIAQTLPGYNNYWYAEGQKYDALRALEDLRKFAARDKFYSRVKSPVLMLYYHRDEEHEDKVASVPAMLEAFEEFSSTSKKQVPMPDGNHVLTSAYVKSDKAPVFREILEFVETL